MQRDRVDGGPARFQPFQQRRGNMQPSGRGRRRPVLAGKNGLVGRLVLLGSQPSRGDIGRQGHLAALGDGLVENGTMEGKRKGYLASFIFLCNLSIKLAEEENRAL